jgi:hypothetical protein
MPQRPGVQFRQEHIEIIILQLSDPSIYNKVLVVETVLTKTPALAEES